jgi:hypothetical protein
MGQKPKARSPAKKTSAAEKQKEQSARFIKAAREIGVDETGAEFEKALIHIAKNKTTKSGTLP